MIMGGVILFIFAKILQKYNIHCYIYMCIYIYLKDNSRNINLRISSPLKLFVVQSNFDLSHRSFPYFTYCDRNEHQQ